MSNKTKLAELPTAGVTLSDLVDGVGYRVESLALSQPNLFTRLGALGDLVLKVPSDLGRTDFDKYVRREITDPQDIRRNEELERFGSLGKAIERFPAYQATLEAFGAEFAHFLVVHHLQHARLQEANVIALPSTRFIVLAWPRWLFGWRTAPAIVQERIHGICLFDMVEPMEGVFLSGYSHLRPQLKRQLEPLVNSALRVHVDWNIQNFIWQEASQRLYYVDSKPTTLASRFSVEHNLSSVREVFLA